MGVQGLMEGEQAAQAFLKQLKEGLLDPALPLLVFDSLPSTNATALDWARKGAPQGACVLAFSQTQGRGRFGRGFFSPAGGLYLSVIVDSLGLAPGLLTTLAAVCACEAVQAQTGQRLLIKWVNDLKFQGKKAGGILAEGVMKDGQLAQTVLGIGLNLGPSAFPADLKQSATTLYREGQIIDRAALALGIIHRVLAGIKDPRAHLPRYRALCETLGQKVSFLWQGQQTCGQAVDLDPEGALLVQTDQGLLRLFSGEISLLKG